ncbi:hypothetical protein MMC25_000172 [Agyrium rufum]|nr:hypothetical protein [Agyrium rufum]
MSQSSGVSPSERPSLNSKQRSSGWAWPRLVDIDHATPRKFTSNSRPTSIRSNQSSATNDTTSRYHHPNNTHLSEVHSSPLKRSDIPQETLETDEDEPESHFRRQPSTIYDHYQPPRSSSYEHSNTGDSSDRSSVASVVASSERREEEPVSRSSGRQAEISYETHQSETASVNDMESPRSEESIFGPHLTSPFDEPIEENVLAQTGEMIPLSGSGKTTKQISSASQADDAAPQASSNLGPPRIVIIRATEDSADSPEISNLHSFPNPEVEGLPVPFSELPQANALNRDSGYELPIASRMPKPVRAKRRKRKLVIRKTRNVVLRSPVLKMLLGRELAAQAGPVLKALANGTDVREIELGSSTAAAGAGMA